MGVLPRITIGILADLKLDTLIFIPLPIAFNIVSDLKSPGLP